MRTHPAGAPTRTLRRKSNHGPTFTSTAISSWPTGSSTSAEESAPPARAVSDTTRRDEKFMRACSLKTSTYYIEGIAIAAIEEGLRTFVSKSQLNFTTAMPSPDKPFHFHFWGRHATQRVILNCIESPENNGKTTVGNGQRCVGRHITRRVSATKPVSLKANHVPGSC